MTNASYCTAIMFMQIHITYNYCDVEHLASMIDSSLMQIIYNYTHK